MSAHESARRAWRGFLDSEPAWGRCVSIALILCALSFAAQGWLGFNPQDEAFLWYGVVRTHSGELPLRDFRAYDPGRYLWSAAWAAWFGDGLVAVRAASAIFACIGISAGLLVVSRATRHPIHLVFAGVVFVVWMATPWKLYEPSIALLGVWVATRVLEQPSRARWVACGLFVGIAAFFGRNLGVYSGFGMILVAVHLRWKARESWLRSLPALSAGTVVGYAPMLLLIAFAPGFGTAFLDSIAFYLRQSDLNVSRPVPWPWLVHVAQRPFSAVARELSIGALFALVPLSYAIGAVLAARTRPEKVAHVAPILAAVFLGIPFFHHASVASESSHLAQCIHPFLVVTLCASLAFRAERARRVRVVSWTALGVLTWFAVVSVMPIVRRATAPEGQEFGVVRVGRDDLWLPPGSAASVNNLRRIIRRNVPEDEPVFVTAQHLAVLPMFERKSPVWDIYPAWPADGAEQDRMLRELESVRWALVDSRPLGGDPRVKFERTHPRVWSMLHTEFERVPVTRENDELQLLRRKDR